MQIEPRHFRGIGASPGIAIGRVFLLDRGTVRVPRYHIQPTLIDAEIVRLATAIARSVDQLEAIRGRFVGGGMDHQAILEAHEMMLRDRALLEEAISLIRLEQLNAEWAISRVITRLRNLFEQLSDASLRERRGDIDFVGERILRNLVGQHADVAEVADILPESVVVARDLSPVDTALLTRKEVLAFVTEVGGKTSHTSIIARSLEVPAVVGVHGVFDASGSGDRIIVDGSDGVIMLRPSPAQLERGSQRRAAHQAEQRALVGAHALPARTRDGREVQIAGNIELPAEVTTVLARGGEAIGLYRTEFMFLGRQTAPNEDDHYVTYCRIFDAMQGRPVVIRTFDLGGDKFMGPTPLEHEPNPALGLRAIRFCLQHRAIFEAQIAGLLRAASRGDLRIMLPMISGLEELREARSIIAMVAARLSESGQEHRADVPVGIMVEVPSAALVADQLAQESDFFAIGTNDLMQYLLAIDRTNERVAYLYRPLHPAVLRTLRMIQLAAASANIPVSVCGEMAGDVEYLPILLGLGFTQLSMNTGSIAAIKRQVRALDYGQCVRLAAAALGATTTQEVERLVAESMAAESAVK